MEQGEFSDTGSTYEYNVANSVSGGAVVLLTMASSSISISSSRFYFNTGPNGGALHVGYVFNLNVSSCEFYGNYAVHGGAIYCNQVNYNLENITAEGNSASNGMINRINIH